MDAFKSIHPVPAAWLRDSDLAAFVPAYVRRLVDRHYAANTVRMYLYGVAHFAHWTRRCRIGVRDVADDVVLRFVEEHLPRCTCSSPVQRCRHQVRAELRQLLITLVDAGVLISSRQPDAIDDQLERFDTRMQHARGLAETTWIRWLRVVLTIDADHNIQRCQHRCNHATTLPRPENRRHVKPDQGHTCGRCIRIRPANQNISR